MIQGFVCGRRGPEGRRKNEGRRKKVRHVPRDSHFLSVFFLVCFAFAATLHLPRSPTKQRGKRGFWMSADENDAGPAVSLDEKLLDSRVYAFHALSHALELCHALGGSHVGQVGGCVGRCALAPIGRQFSICLLRRLTFPSCGFRCHDRRGAHCIDIR
ncbi:hypothetical protein VTK56DRAFT_9348 [Thermocarpiscus australiensis]